MNSNPHQINKQPINGSNSQLAYGVSPSSIYTLGRSNADASVYLNNISLIPNSGFSVQSKRNFSSTPSGFSSRKKNNKNCGVDSNLKKGYQNDSNMINHQPAIEIDRDYVFSQSKICHRLSVKIILLFFERY